jgi:hypothetical protein
VQEMKHRGGGSPAPPWQPPIMMRAMVDRLGFYQKANTAAPAPWVLARVAEVEAWRQGAAPRQLAEGMPRSADFAQKTPCSSIFHTFRPQAAAGNVRIPGGHFRATPQREEYNCIKRAPLPGPAGPLRNDLLQLLVIFCTQSCP